MHLEEISSSEMRAWQRCKRQWWLRYFRYLKAPEGSWGPQNVGNMVHAALEAFYSSSLKMDPIEAINKLYEKAKEEFPEYQPKLEMDKGLAITMVLSYMQYREEELIDIDLEFHETETRHSVVLGDTGFKLTGRVDAKATRKSTGGRVPIDHKTVDSFDQIPRTAQIDNQFLTYFLIDFLEHDKTMADSLIINMLRRVNSNHPDAKPPFFGRYEVRYNLDELRNHWKHVLAICLEVDSAISRLIEGEDHQSVVPPSPNKDCAWSCSFRMICPMFDDGSNVEYFIEENYEIGKTYDHQRDPVVWQGSLPESETSGAV